MKFTAAALNLLAGLTVTQAEQVLVNSLWSTGSGDLSKGEFSSNGVFFRIDKYDCEGRYVGPEVSDRIVGGCVEIINEGDIRPAQWDFTLEGYTLNNFDINMTIWHTYEDGVERTGSGTIDINCWQNGGVPWIMCQASSGVWITLE